MFLAQAQPFSPGLGVKPRLWQVPNSGAFPSVVELRRCGQSLLEGGEGWGKEEAGPRGEEKGIRVPAIESPSPSLLHLPADHGGSVEWLTAFELALRGVSVASDHLKLVGMTPRVFPSRADHGTRLSPWGVACPWSGCHSTAVTRSVPGWNEPLAGNKCFQSSAWQKPTPSPHTPHPGVYASDTGRRT